MINPINLEKDDQKIYNLKVNTSDLNINLPLFILLNARSIYNKRNNLKEMLNQLAPDICLISETFEREKEKVDKILEYTSFKSITYYRKNKSPGGGCAIIFNCLP